MRITILYDDRSLPNGHDSVLSDRLEVARFIDNMHATELNCWHIEVMVGLAAIIIGKMRISLI